MMNMDIFSSDKEDSDAGDDEKSEVKKEEETPPVTGSDDGEQSNDGGGKTGGKQKSDDEDDDEESDKDHVERTGQNRKKEKGKKKTVISSDDDDDDDDDNDDDKGPKEEKKQKEEEKDDEDEDNDAASPKNKSDDRKDSDASYNESPSDKASSNEDEKSENSEEQEEEEEGSGSEDEESSPAKSRKSQSSSKQRMTKSEVRKMMEIAGEVRRSGRSTRAVKRLEMGTTEDSDDDDDSDDDGGHGGGRRGRRKRKKASVPSTKQRKKKNTYESESSDNDEDEDEDGEEESAEEESDSESEYSGSEQRKRKSKRQTSGRGGGGGRKKKGKKGRGGGGGGGKKGKNKRGRVSGGGGRRGRGGGRKAGNSSSDEDGDGGASDGSDSRSYVRRAATKEVKYVIPDSDNDIDTDDVLEWDETEPTTSGVEEQTDTIEKVLKDRWGRKSATGHQTTVYNVEDKGDPNSNFEPNGEEEAERQFRIKWIGWSHIHNTWETEAGIRASGVKGIKKLENYISRMKDIERWKRKADKDSIEYYELEQEMAEQLSENYTKCERIVAHQKGKEEGSVDYFVKWFGLPYSECTWEDGHLVGRWYQSHIEAYNERRASKNIPRYEQLPTKSKRLKGFTVFKEQPDFIGDDNDTLKLRDYQLAGLNWLLHAFHKGNSVILADEMGLGKTIQTISFLSTLCNEYAVFGPFLIIVPLSTMAAWQKESALWAPSLNTIIYLGDVQSRELIRQYEWYAAGTKRVKFNCCLTTYEILNKDKAFLNQLEWKVIAVDEAHRLKNHESMLYRHLSEFNADHRLLITGTPLQNDLKELWALLHFIMPDQFENWEDFEDRHGKSESRGFGSLHQELEPFLLRRVKKDVEKSLPAKVEQILRVDMTAIQKQLYKWVLTKNYKELSRGVAKGSQGSFLNIMMELKKCCNHAHLTKPLMREAENPHDRLEELIKASGKLILLDKLLMRLKEKGNRVLIFSQMVMMLDILQEYLRIRRFNFQRLDGTMRGELRRQALDHFNEPGSLDFAFLLSTKAGGLGLNLATADTVVIFDSDWNPQNDLQAQSRAHRIGQKKQVNIYRLVTKGSVEEDIVERAKQKLVLDHLVIQRMDTSGRTVLAKNATGKKSAVPFNREELSSILKFGAEELFKEKEGEEKDPEVDIDAVLQLAETRAAEDESTLGDELLGAFKVATFAIDEEEKIEMGDDGNEEGRKEKGKSWLDIIPEHERLRIEEEEQKAAEAELNLGPRQRNKKADQQKKEEEDSDDDWRKSQKRGRGGGRGGKRGGGGGGGSDSDSGVSDSDDEKPAAKKAKKVMFGFSEIEVKRFLKSFRKFARPQSRLEAIGSDAGLEDHSDGAIRNLLDALVRACKTAQTQAAAGAQAAAEDPDHGKENEEDGGKVKKPKDKGPSFKFGGVDVQVKNLLKTPNELEPLYSIMPESSQERKHFQLTVRPKLMRSWDTEWEEADDAALLRGIYEYGYGAWDSIKMDPDLGLTEKVIPQDKSKKPQGKHLQYRADYLLRLLRKDDEPASVKNDRGTGGKSSGGKGAADSGGAGGPKGEGDGAAGAGRKGGRGGAKRDAGGGKSSAKDKDAAGLKDSSPDSPSTSTAVAENGLDGGGKANKSNKKGSKGKKASGGAGGDEGGVLNKKSPEYLVDHCDVNMEFATALEDQNQNPFKECKTIMKDQRKAIRRLTRPEKPEDFNNSLRKLGDHISASLIIKAKSRPKQLEKWTSYLWIFISQFFENLDGARLQSLYRKFKDGGLEEKESAAGAAANGKGAAGHHHHHHHHEDGGAGGHHHSNNSNSGKKDKHHHPHHHHPHPQHQQVSSAKKEHHHSASPNPKDRGVKSSSSSSGGPNSGTQKNSSGGGQNSSNGAGVIVGGGILKRSAPSGGGGLGRGEGENDEWRHSRYEDSRYTKRSKSDGKGYNDLPNPSQTNTHPAHNTPLLNRSHHSHQQKQQQQGGGPAGSSWNNSQRDSMKQRYRE